MAQGEVSSSVFCQHLRKRLTPTGRTGPALMLSGSHSCPRAPSLLWKFVLNQHLRFRGVFFSVSRRCGEKRCLETVGAPLAENVTVEKNWAFIN